MIAALPYLFDQLRAHLHWLDQMMADGRSFLQGAAAGLADLAAYHPIWFLQRNFGPAAAPLGGFPRLLSWAERVAAIGHGDRRPMTSKGALAVASAVQRVGRRHREGYCESFSGRSDQQLGGRLRPRIR